MPKKVTFKVESFRRIPCPLGRDKRTENPQQSFVAVCNVKHLPETFPMDTNPREQNLKTKVAKKIEHSLLHDYDSNFHILNRGLVLSADTVKFNNETNMLSLTFSNEEKHGDIDGGHTYKIILANRDKLEFDQYVKIEILTGIEDFFEDVAGARNTSVQVQDKSLAELEGKFDTIKESIGKEDFADRIAYKENAEGDIDIREVVAILTMFNINRYDDSTHPVTAYSQKQTCITHYLADMEKDNNPFDKMKLIAPKIFAIYNAVEKKMPTIYNSKEGGGRYGKVKGVVYKDGREFHQLLFASGEEFIPYETPKGFVYPIVAAFRAIVEENSETGYYQWSNGVDPLKYFNDNDLATELVVSTIERSRSLGNNPQSVGKDSGHWSQLYKTVRTKFLEDMLKKYKTK